VNVCVMECYYKSQPVKYGYRKWMFAIWKTVFPDTTITKQRLLDQKRTILRNELLGPLEIDEIKASTQSNNNPSQLTPQPNAIFSPTQEDSVPAVMNEQQKILTLLSTEEALLLSDIQQAMSQFSTIKDRPRLKRIQFSRSDMRSLIDAANTVVGRAHIFLKQILYFTQLLM